MLNRFCYLSDVKKFSNKTKRLHIVATILNLIAQRGKGDWRRFTHSGNLNELPPMFVRCVNGQVATMNREKGGRHQFLDKWLKEFGWLQTRGPGDDLSMIVRIAQKQLLPILYSFDNSCL